MNPLSGRDVRRLLGRAGNDTPDAKRNQLERAAIGAAHGGRRADPLDARRVPHRASGRSSTCRSTPCASASTSAAPRRGRRDTLRSVAAMREAGCGALLVLGGDGTNRLVAQAWPDAPIVPLSTGTNNVFPQLVEPTLAGAAAGLVAAGRLALAEVAERAKVVRVRYADGAESLALVDAGLLRGRPRRQPARARPGQARARWCWRAPSRPRWGSRRSAASCEPCGRADDFGVEVRVRRGRARAARAGLARASIAPRSSPPSRRLALGETVEVKGPGVLAFDGDRERALAPGERAELRVRRDGPWVIDVARALALAAARGLYWGRPHVHEPDADGHGPGLLLSP